MGSGPSSIGTRRVLRFAFAGMTAAVLAGCADSSRFIGDPLGNPFKSASNDMPPAGSGSDMAPPPAYRPSRSAISSSPLAPPPGTSARHVASYDAAPHDNPRLPRSYDAPATDRTASIASANGHGSWSTTGGMSIIAANGESASVLAERYNVPTETLLHVNGLSSPAQVHAGTRLVIPVYSAGGSAAPRSERIARAESVEPRETTSKHDHSARARLLAKHETHEARREEPEHEKMHWVKGPSPAKLAEVEKDKTKTREKLARAERKAHAAEADEDAAPVKQKPVRTAKAAPVETVPEAAPAKPSKAAMAEKRDNVDPTPTASLPPADEKVATSDAPEFRWPAHGRIIQGFKSGGNDGINIAVPEGTAVKAAESGVVAYAGSEIKGFGNLVLIRHPNGYVTAYANNSDLAVHRGEQVKRGQVIAKSGQSGNVASPQLHFELRKGSTPVDPTRYLAGL